MKKSTSPNDKSPGGNRSLWRGIGKEVPDWPEATKFDPKL